MKINLIVAVNKTGGIGFENTIPWKLPEDLAYFKAATMGLPMIMGRSTWDSFPKPLNGRTHIVVTNRPFFTDNPAVRVVDSYEEALKVAEEYADKVFVIGGVSAYQAFWNVADELYLTRVDAFTPQDTILDLSDLATYWELYTKSTRLTSKCEPYLKYSHEVYTKKQLDLFN